MKRYEENQNIRASSWIEISKDTLKNKAKASTTRRAIVHAGEQQMAVQISVERKTITMEVLEFKELQRYEYHTVVINGEKHYINCSSAASENINLTIVGPWNPLTGAVELYHYQETFPATAAMLPKFLEWRVDGGNNPLSPTATH